MKKLIIAFTLLTGFQFYGQTLDELKSDLSAKKDSITTLQKEADAIQALIDTYPGWKLGAFGVIGGSISNFNNWYSQGTPNNSSGNIGITLNAYANLDREDFFWRNALTTNLSWVKFDDKDDETDDDDFSPTTDVFDIYSLYGYKLTETIAASAMAEYRTTLLNNFNDPGYLDVGVGATWTPIPNLVVVVHPLNYNFVFADNDAVFESSLGAKIMADYTRQIGNIAFKSNLSMFQSYKSSNLSNWTWTNSFSYTLWKMIGVGFEFGLRNNKQEALNYALANYDPALTDAAEPTFDNLDNDLQTYWTLGLSYKF